MISFIVNFFFSYSSFHSPCCYTWNCGYLPEKITAIPVILLLVFLIHLLIKHFSLITDKAYCYTKYKNCSDYSKMIVPIPPVDGRMEPVLFSILTILSTAVPFSTVRVQSFSSAVVLFVMVTLIASVSLL